MIAIGEDRRTIYLTRGDKTSEFFRLAFYFPIWNFATQQEEKYTFKLTDKIGFIVKEKKGRSIKSRKDASRNGIY